MAQADKFENVELHVKSNVYFEGRIVSHTFYAEGVRRTIGFIYPGEYELGTADAEIMDMVSGEADVMLPGSDSWVSKPAGESFNVSADSKFKMRTSGIAEYVCTYIPK